MSEQDNTPVQPQADSPAGQQPMQQPFQQQQAPQQQWQQPYQQQPQQWQQPMQQPYQQQPYQQQWQQPYQQQGAYYAQPGAQAVAPAPQKNALALASMICGIAAIVFCLCIFIGVFQNVVGIVFGGIGIAAGIAAIVLGVLARKVSPDKKGMAGLVCGIVGAVLAIILIPVSITAIYPAAHSAMKGSSSKSAQKASLADTINGEVIADDAIMTMKLTRMEIDDKGDLNVYFTLTNNNARSDVEITVSTKSGEAWELNGKKVEAVAISWAKGGETKEDQCITIPSSYLDITDVDEVESLSGEIEVDFKSSSQGLTYKVDLYA